MKKVFIKFLIVLITVVLLGMQNVYADNIITPDNVEENLESNIITTQNNLEKALEDNIITKDNLKNALKEYICNGKMVSVTIDNQTITVGTTEKLPEEQLQVTEDTITVMLKSEQSGLDTDLSFVYNYTIENNQIAFSSVLQSTDQTMLAEEFVISTSFLPMLYLSVTDCYGIDSEKALYYFITEGSLTSEENQTEATVNTEVYSFRLTSSTINLTVNLDKLSIIETINPSDNNQNSSNNENNNSGSNNSNNNEDDRGTTTNRGDVDRKDNTEAEGKLPYTGTHIGIAVIAIVSIMLIVGIINKRKYKDIK